MHTYMYLLDRLDVCLLHPAYGALELLIHFENLRLELVMGLLQQPLFLLCMYVCMCVFMYVYFNEWWSDRVLVRLGLNTLIG